MALSATDKIAALEAKRKRLDEQLRDAVAKAKENDRKRLARRQTVVGTAILAAIEGDESLAELVSLALAMHVTMPADRSVIADLLERAEKANGKNAGVSETKAA